MTEQVAVRAGTNFRESARGRHPALLAAIVFAAGIAFDHFWTLSVYWWLPFGAASIGAAYAVRPSGQRRRLAICGTLAAVFATGGLRHHLVWGEISPDDCSIWCSSEPQVVELEGVIGTPIEVRDRPVGPRIPPWMEIDRSTCTLLCTRLIVEGQRMPVVGRAKLDVAGHVVDVTVGDKVRVLGRMMLQGAPCNPGEFDYRTLLQRQGISCRFNVDHPAAIQKMAAATGWQWTLARWRSQLRGECQRLLKSELKPPLPGLASSLLLGDRSGLTEELQGQFVETGMVHLLAISGMNVGIFLAVVLIFGRAFKLTSQMLAVSMLCATVLFLWITEHQPSVIRAGLMAVVGLCSTFVQRRVDGWNTLASCGGVLLIWNPLDLFDIGAQFSFLAVGAIIWTSRTNVWHLWQSRSAVLPEISLGRRWFEQGLCVVAQMYLVTAAIWLATLPVSMANFHIVTPVGLLLDLLLIPLSTVTLAVGYLFLAVGLLSPWAAGWIAIPFEWGLLLMQGATAWGQHIPGGHFFVPTIPHWWLAGFYLLLGMIWTCSAMNARPQRPARVLAVWIFIGLALPSLPRSEQSFRCTFLSVGHGLACVMELPGGETVLYDAGTLGDGRIAQRAVESLLSERGVSHVEMVLLSHADHDHFSGLFDLLRQFPVQQMCLTQQSARSPQQAMLDLRNEIEHWKIPVQVLQKGDELRCGTGQHAVTFRVLHPDAVMNGVNDNSQSLVLQVNVCGRTLLLTGDLEQTGLDALLQQPARVCDVLLSPHHGGKASNMKALFDWAQPDYVIVSGRHTEMPHLKDAGRSRLLNTATSGAITLTVTLDGKIQVDEFLKPVTGSSQSLVGHSRNSSQSRD